MTTLHARDRIGATKRPFSWISRLYRRAPQSEELGSVSRNTSSPSSGATFLGITASSTNSFQVNDDSSLRPTISTRAPSVAPSMASNAAVHNVEAFSSPLTITPGVSSFSGTSVTKFDSQEAQPPLPLSTAIPRVSMSETTSEASFQTSEQDLAPLPTALSRTVDSESLMPDNTYAASQSSRNSAMTSLFSTRTAETQPTISNLTQRAGSIISTRTGNAGLGATDNASMLTLASSSKGNRRRRNSTDTNCSVLAIAPASARGSFESSRTGLTDTRRTGVPNSNHLAFLDDVLPSSSRSSRLLADGLSSRRSISGLSALSDSRSVQSSEITT